MSIPIKGLSQARIQEAEKALKTSSIFSKSKYSQLEDRVVSAISKVSREAIKSSSSVSSTVHALVDHIDEVASSRADTPAKKIEERQCLLEVAKRSIAKRLPGRELSFDIALQTEQRNRVLKVITRNITDPNTLCILDQTAIEPSIERFEETIAQIQANDPSRSLREQDIALELGRALTRPKIKKSIDAYNLKSTVGLDAEVDKIIASPLFVNIQNKIYALIDHNTNQDPVLPLTEDQIVHYLDTKGSKGSKGYWEYLSVSEKAAFLDLIRPIQQSMAAIKELDKQIALHVGQQSKAQASVDRVKARWDTTTITLGARTILPFLKANHYNPLADDGFGVYAIYKQAEELEKQLQAASQLAEERQKEYQEALGLAQEAYGADFTEAMLLNHNKEAAHEALKQLGREISDLELELRLATDDGARGAFHATLQEKHAAYDKAIAKESACRNVKSLQTKLKDQEAARTQLQDAIDACNAAVLSLTAEQIDKLGKSMKFAPPSEYLTGHLFEPVALLRQEYDVALAERNQKNDQVGKLQEEKGHIAEDFSATIKARVEHIFNPAKLKEILKQKFTKIKEVYQIFQARVDELIQSHPRAVDPASISHMAKEHASANKEIRLLHAVRDEDVDELDKLISADYMAEMIKIARLKLKDQNTVNEIEELFKQPKPFAQLKGDARERVFLLLPMMISLHEKEVLKT